MTFSLESDNQRNYFRVRPPDALELWLDGSLATLVDIGAGGLSVRNPGCKTDALRTVRLRLPSPAAEITATLRFVEVDADNVCHGMFVDIDPGAVEAIHRYVLEMQKQAIRASRREKIETGED